MNLLAEFFHAINPNRLGWRSFFNETSQNLERYSTQTQAVTNEKKINVMLVRSYIRN